MFETSPAPLADRDRSAVAASSLERAESLRAARGFSIAAALAIPLWGLILGVIGGIAWLIAG